MLRIASMSLGEGVSIGRCPRFVPDGGGVFPANETWWRLETKCILHKWRRVELYHEHGLGVAIVVATGKTKDYSQATS